MLVKLAGFREWQCEKRWNCVCTQSGTLQAMPNWFCEFEGSYDFFLVGKSAQVLFPSIWVTTVSAMEKSLLETRGVSYVLSATFSPLSNV
jgi:hypothetical protein